MKIKLNARCGCGWSTVGTLQDALTAHDTLAEAEEHARVFNHTVILHGEIRVFKPGQIYIENPRGTRKRTMAANARKEFRPNGSHPTRA